MQDHQNGFPSRGLCRRDSSHCLYRQTFQHKSLLMLIFCLIIVIHQHEKDILSEAFLNPKSRAFYHPREHDFPLLGITKNTSQNHLAIYTPTQNSGYKYKRNSSSKNIISFQNLKLYETKISDALSSETKVDDLDKPMPTAAGGFTHTKLSREKISVANKGRIPWNKGKSRSDEVKARIAEGVRRSNRQKFLKKLEDMGLTEEEYLRQKMEEKQKIEAEKKSRRTERGGYKPTDATKAKISAILKEKHARGEVKKREYKGPFRKGFQHSEETKEKISTSLRKRWAEDSHYQARMRNKDIPQSKNIREKISNRLKERWQEPEFRERMIQSFKKRKESSPRSEAQREKLSIKMKEKWLDKDYREKMMKGIADYRKTLPPRPKPVPRKRKTSVSVRKKIDSDGETLIRKKVLRKSKRKVKRVKKNVNRTYVVKKKAVTTAKVTKAEKPKPKKDGDISRMREERRDLYDLLYGDEGEGAPKSAEVCDELDNFDPYGLKDF